MRTIVLRVACGIGLFIVGASAQHEEHHKDQAAPPATQADSAKPGMAGGMMSHMQMMNAEQETAKLTDELLKSFAAIQSEKDPAALKAKLEAHGALLKELQAKVQSHAHMMEMMHQMMGGKMMEGSPDNTGKK